MKDAALATATPPATARRPRPSLLGRNLVLFASYLAVLALIAVAWA